MASIKIIADGQEINDIDATGLDESVKLKVKRMKNTLSDLFGSKLENEDENAAIVINIEDGEYPNIETEGNLSSQLVQDITEARQVF